MSKRSGSKKHARVRDAVFARDNWTCQMCGLYLPPEDWPAPDPSGMSAHDRGEVVLTLDHIVPVAAGGRWVLGNLQTACRPCNKFKSVSEAQANWPDRIERAVMILQSRPPTSVTVNAAIQALTGADGFTRGAGSAPHPNNPASHGGLT